MRSRSIRPTKTVWVGTGEANPRNDVSYGDGVYKSDRRRRQLDQDAVCKGTRYISRILVDPRNHNHVIVGALGDVFSDSSERGVYVTDDGGKTWKQTLYVGPGERRLGSRDGRAESKRALRRHLEVSAPAVDVRQRRHRGRSLQIDRRRRNVDEARRGTVFRRRRSGASASRSRRATAIASTPLIESKDGVLWRSDDGGANWTMVSDDSMVDARPFYFSHVAVDPKNPNRVYAVSFQADAEHRRRQDVQSRRARRPRRFSRDLDRAERPDAHHRRRGRRLRAHARRRRQLVLFAEPADRSGLPRRARHG